MKPRNIVKGTSKTKKKTNKKLAAKKAAKTRAKNKIEKRIREEVISAITMSQNAMREQNLRSEMNSAYNRSLR